MHQLSLCEGVPVPGCAPVPEWPAHAAGQIATPHDQAPWRANARRWMELHVKTALLGNRQCRYRCGLGYRGYRDIQENSGKPGKIAGERLPAGGSRPRRFPHQRPGGCRSGAGRFGTAEALAHCLRLQHRGLDTTAIMETVYVIVANLVAHALRIVKSAADESPRDLRYRKWLWQRGANRAGRQPISACTTA